MAASAKAFGFGKVLAVKAEVSGPAMLRGLADHDPSEVVIDEVAGQLLAFCATSYGLWHAGVTSLP